MDFGKGYVNTSFEMMAAFLSELPAMERTQAETVLAGHAIDGGFLLRKKDTVRVVVSLCGWCLCCECACLQSFTVVIMDCLSLSLPRLSFFLYNFCFGCLADDDSLLVYVTPSMILFSGIFGAGVVHGLERKVRAPGDLAGRRPQPERCKVGAQRKWPA